MLVVGSSEWLAIKEAKKATELATPNFGVQRNNSLVSVSDSVSNTDWDAQRYLVSFESIVTTATTVGDPVPQIRYFQLRQC